MQEISGKGNENQAVWRKGRRHVARLETVDAIGSLKVDPQGTYLITGGVGGLGLIVADLLIKQGAKQLVLTSRRDPSVETEAKLDQLRAQGANIIHRKVDVTNVSQVKGLISEYSSSLKGIIHAAGVSENAIFRNQSWDKV